MKLFRYCVILLCLQKGWRAKTVGGLERKEGWLLYAIDLDKAQQMLSGIYP